MGVDERWALEIHFCVLFLSNVIIYLQYRIGRENISQ